MIQYQSHPFYLKQHLGIRSWNCARSFSIETPKWQKSVLGWKVESSPESVFNLSVVISLHHNPDDHVQRDESDDAGDDELDDGDEDEEGQ